ncbi:hypothetical protein HOB10_03570 [Candidatus Parcubacteria bacterium]|jgi:hypothetical protein|nr:hypothetical protein [Candidatus Parcubacteria bacterium]
MTKRTKPNKGNVYVKIVGFFLFLTIVAIFVILHFALSKVTITINSVLEEKQASVLVEMQSENTEEMSSDILLGKIISVEFELNTTTASNQEEVPSTKAGGYVTIYNNYSRDQVLIATTRLLTSDNKLYRIADRVEIPVGGQAEVWAEADQEGEQFVIEATTFIIPGLWEGLQEMVYAESKDGMKLQSVPKYLVTQENLDTVKQNLETQAREQGLKVVNDILSDNLKIQDEQLFLEYETIEFTPLGTETKEVSLTQKVSAYGVVFSPDDLNKISQEKFGKELKESQSVIKLDAENFVYKIIEIDLEKESAVIEASINATINSDGRYWDIDKEKIIGLNEAGIKDYLQQLGVEDVQVNFFPNWITTAPKIKDHIIIE